MDKVYNEKDIARNQGMIDEWKQEAKAHNECAILMFTIDANDRIRMFRNGGVSDRLLQKILFDTLATIGTKK